MKFSDMTKEELRRTPYFHQVEPEKLEGLKDYTAWLEAILHNPCSVFERNGESFLIENKQLIEKVNGLKIEIYSNEHPPPHFHVKSANVNASFDIENCDILEGNINSKDLKKIKYWHNHAKQILIKTWNSTRPGGCTVGEYKNT